VLSAATLFPPVTAAVLGATVVSNGILGYPLGLQNERIAEMVQRSATTTAAAAAVTTTSPLAKKMSPPSRALHYYEA
jgi:hypothetical protein